MEDVPQGGAGGVPLDDTDQKHPLHPPRGEGEPDTGDQGDATTAEPGRSRRLDPQETTDQEDDQPTES
ncbi:hypothetical protein [Kitasatospora sp. NPDC085464]|uniref:hypothetical protein n=1 Tax=Kitasatospora sp. NPDC085464 TaxID=3364063 RepID=UPI0037C821B9